MNTDKKTRVDAFEAALTEAQRWELYDVFRASPWYEAAKHAAESFGIEAPSKSAMYRFAAAMRTAESERRIVQALEAKAEIGRSMEQVGGVDAELAHAWEQLALESALRGDPEAGKRYQTLAMEIRAAGIEAEKLRLKQEAESRARESLSLEREKFEEQRRKNEQAREALETVKAKGGIDEETLRKIEEAVNLL